MQQQCWYSKVSLVPNPFRQESVNVAIIVGAEGGGWKILENIQRGTLLTGTASNLISEALQQARSQLGPQSQFDPNTLMQLHNQHGMGTTQFGSPQPIIGDLDELAAEYGPQSLYSLLVADPTT